MSTSAPCGDSEWGFTGIFDRKNGGGFLTDHYPEAGKAIWNFEGEFARSRHIPKVRIPNIIHPGLIGTAPSAPLCASWNKREAELISTSPGGCLRSQSHRTPRAPS